MRFVHLSDLHIGKRVNEYSMIDDQRYILDQILGIIDSILPDGVIIAGDIYDKAVPSAEAVELFDEFLFKLSERNVYVFVISGNHDSPERIAFGGRLMEKSRVYLSPVYDGSASCVTLTDIFGDINIYMLPFIKPASVRRFYPDDDISTYTDAVRVAVDKMNVDPSKRNILITHQFVTGADRTESEEISVGGTDNVDVSVFDAFDYVALGHIHRAQRCSKDTVRYSGTPLKYSFSEAKDTKSLTRIDINKKGSVGIHTVSLVPKRDMHEIKGTYEELMNRDFYSGTDYTDAYMHITLTDEEDIPDAIGKLRTVYKNLMRLDYDNTRTKTNSSIEFIAGNETKSPLELFGDFYEAQNNAPLSEVQLEFITKLIEQVWEGEK